MLLLVIVIILLLVFLRRSQKDPFRYIWSLALLEQKYRELAHNDSLSSSIKEFYRRARLRIEEGEKKSSWFSARFFAEVEYVMKTRRSPDVLRKRAWEYAKELAEAYGYNEDEVEKEDFSCPGWNELWGLYHAHKDRILSKKPENSTKWQWAGSAAFGDSFKNKSASDSYKKNHSEHQQAASEKVKSKNQNLFQNIWNLKELKKKYFRLAKLNHPDQGGSDEAMKMLNRYYQEAFQRILAREDS